MCTHCCFPWKQLQLALKILMSCAFVQQKNKIYFVQGWKHSNKSQVVFFYAFVCIMWSHVNVFQGRWVIYIYIKKVIKWPTSRLTSCKQTKNIYCTNRGGINNKIPWPNKTLNSRNDLTWKQVVHVNFGVIKHQSTPSAVVIANWNQVFTKWQEKAGNKQQQCKKMRKADS